MFKNVPVEKHIELTVLLRTATKEPNGEVLRRLLTEANRLMDEGARPLSEETMQEIRAARFNVNNKTATA